MSNSKPARTTSCCPVCLQLLPAYKTIKGQNVYLKKSCAQHGDFEILISKDSKRFTDKTFSSTGKTVYENQTQVSEGCPSDCGLCPDHQQHLCTALIEITDRCDLQCPICYFGEAGSSDISIDEFKARLATVLRTENGELDILQISGGEPTQHRHFPQILETALEENINRILINTNGLSILDSDVVFNSIRDNKDRTEVYLQFDGYNESANRILRGADFSHQKEQVIEKLNAADIKICLAVTLIPENLSEIRNILDLATKVKNITGVTFQRFSHSGRGVGLPNISLTQEDILQAIDDTNYLRYEHIVPLPCSHENCTSISFIFVADNQMYPLGKYIDFAKHQSIIKDRLQFDSTVLTELKKELACTSSGCCSWIIDNRKITRKLREFTNGRASNYNNMKMLRIVVKNFMDAETFDTERAKKCCVGVSIGGDRIIPFCVNNIFNKRQQLPA